MSSRLEDMVAWIEQFDLETHLSDPEQLAEVLGERQVVLAELERADRSQVSKEKHHELKGRLEAVLARDAKVLSALNALREAAHDALEQVSSGRAAARGYGSQSERPNSSVRRVG
jgi:flagellar biosynthesis/type III secretory pathway chaperone